MYARKLTKDELIKSGITEVTHDGHVFKGENEILPVTSRQGYFIHFIYDFDEAGNKIQVPNDKSCFGYNYKVRSIGLHRLMWAWFHEEVPEGMVVDHINNSHNRIEDYYLNNLQLLTQRENILKERGESTLQLPCKIDRPRSYYEDKLAQFELNYEQAKERGDAKLCHKLRTQISQARGRLRYWDAHTEEHNQAVLLKENLKKLRAYATCAKRIGKLDQWHELIEVLNNKNNYSNSQINEIVQAAQEKLALTDSQTQETQCTKELDEAKKKEYPEIAKKKKELKADMERAEKFYRELAAAYGEDDFLVKRYWYEWKFAVIRFHLFCAEVGARVETIS